VELLLAPGLDAVVRGQWDLLAHAGLPSQARHTGPTNAPHVTLAVAEAFADDVERALPAAVATLPLPVRLGGLVVFGAPRRRVLARLVVPGRDLLDLHAAVWAAVARCPGVSEFSRPGHWTPHVTLARGLDDAGVAAALTALATVAASDGTATTARRWDPHARRAWEIGAGGGHPDRRPGNEGPGGGPIAGLD